MSSHSYPSQPIPAEIHSVETLVHSALLDLLGAWKLIRGERTIPTAPREILRHVKPLIKCLHLSEVVDGGADFRFRLIGESVFPGLTEHQVGRLVSEHPDDGIRTRFTMLMRETHRTGRPIRGVSLRKTADERHDYRIESLWLPFGKGPAVEQILSMSILEPVTR